MSRGQQPTHDSIRTLLCAGIAGSANCFQAAAKLLPPPAVRDYFVNYRLWHGGMSESRGKVRQARRVVMGWGLVQSHTSAYRRTQGRQLARSFPTGTAYIWCCRWCLRMSLPGTGCKKTRRGCWSMCQPGRLCSDGRYFRKCVSVEGFDEYHGSEKKQIQTNHVGAELLLRTSLTAHGPKGVCFIKIHLPKCQASAARG